MSLAALMQHWTRPGAVKEFHVWAPGREGGRALSSEVQNLHEALHGANAETVDDVVDALLLAAPTKTLPVRLQTPRATYGRLQARLQYYGLAHGFQAGLDLHATQVQGREQDAWDPEGLHWPVTQVILRQSQWFQRDVEKLHPDAVDACRQQLQESLELANHPALQDMVDFMIVHGERDPCKSMTGAGAVDLARASTWSLTRGFVLGADIIAHHTHDQKRAP